MKELSEMEIEIIAEYEQVLIGNQRVIDPYYFTNKTMEANQDISLLLIQYMTERFLKWSPQKLYESLTMDVLKHWRLAGLLKYIVFPDELNKEKNIGFLAHMIYPNEVKITERDICMSVYSRVCNGEMKKYPKDFFHSNESLNYICFCLKYAIENYTNFKSTEEMYDFFGTASCLKFLRTYKLSTYIKEQFEAPIVAFYLIVPDEQDIPFLFQYYRFWQIFNEHRRQEEESRGKKAVHQHTEISKEDKKYVQVEF